MKRVGFKSKPYEPKPGRQWTGHVPEQSVNATMGRVDRPLAPQPKAEYLRSEAYRRAVAALPCAHCGIAGYTQCAHRDESKGLGIKTSDKSCYPLCGPHPVDWSYLLDPGCHYLIGSSGDISRERRRKLERIYVEKTRAQLAHLLEKL